MEPAKPLHRPRPYRNEPGSIGDVVSQPKNLCSLIDRTPVPAPWSEGDTIPWSEPGFSQRMLREHLSQAHDWASRRSETIDAHVEWLHREILGSKPGKILDLGCGPGLYTARLAALGQRCTGIDYSPASIAYAIEQAKSASLDIDYREADMRTAPFGEGGYDLVLMSFGELNVFPTSVAQTIMKRAGDALAPTGKLVVEVHKEASVRAMGDRPRTWTSHRSGLLSPSPHLLLEESFWDESSRAATKRYFVVDAVTASLTAYAASYQAHSGEDYRALMARAGLVSVQGHPSLSGDLPPRGPCAELVVFVGSRG